MGSHRHAKRIPVIDFSNGNLKPGSGTWLEACHDVRLALEEFGCFEAIYSQVSPELHDTVFATTAKLFDLPTEKKTRNTSDKPYFSYFGQYRFLPLYESMGIDNPTTLEGTKTFTHLMWPNGNERFRKSAQAFSELVVELDRVVMRMVTESYGVDQRCYDYYLGATNYLLRYFKYRTPEMNETTVALPPHVDKAMITIIHQNHVGGLQVMAKDGEWIDLELSPLSFVVMAGEVLMAWSNERIRSCYHQVIMREKETRYSAGMFSFITGKVHVPEELVDDNHPLKYKPFDHFDFLDFLEQSGERKDGKKLPNAIKAYCGVSDT